MIIRKSHTSNLRLLVAIVFLAVMASHPLAAQANVNTAKFFSLVAQTTPGEPTSTGVKMPWFESYELRTETRDFDFDRQEYSFRISPSTRRKVRAQESLYRHLELAPDFKAADDRCQTLADRYADWVEIYFLTQKADLLQQLERVRADQATVLNRLAGTLEFDWSELINIREEQTDLQIDYLTVADQRAYFAELYGLAGSNLDFADILPLSSIRERVLTARASATDSEIAYDLETINRELELEHAEQKQYFDFAQIRYQGPHEDPARERLSVGVALQLPNSGNQVLKIREMELEAESLRQEQARETQAGTEDFNARRQRFLRLFDRYDTFSGLYLREQQELEDLGRKLAGEEGVDPLPLLEIKSRALRNDLKLLRLQAALYDGYLDLMERNGEVCGAQRGEVLR